MPHLLRVSLLLVVALATMSHGGCKNPLAPRSDHRGVIKNITNYTLTKVVIDGELVAWDVLPDQVFVCTKRLEGGQIHTFYAQTDNARVFSQNFTHSVDDQDDQTMWGFSNMGWWWAIGGSFHP